MKLLITGDIVPTEKSTRLFEDKNFLNLFEKDFKEIWKSADYRILNLECPLTNNLNSISKNGALLRAKPESIVGIKSLNPNLMLLANNHIMDYGHTGLLDTIDILNKNKIPYTGIIDNSNASCKTFFIKKENVKIGIYNVCENEFSIATSDSIGANPLNEYKNCMEIRKASKLCDYLIVIFHGGKEFYRYPSPNLQNICRNFIDNGAKFVVTQQSHCIGAEEKYSNGRILYGQGNFLFNNGINNEYWNSSLLIEINIDKSNFVVNYIPIERIDSLISISKDKKIIHEFEKRNKMIKNNNFIQKKYTDFAKANLNLYLSISHKANILTRIFNKLYKGNFYLKLYKKNDLLKILNVIECEAHRELFINGLKNRIKELEGEFNDEID